MRIITQIYIFTNVIEKTERRRKFVLPTKYRNKYYGKAISYVFAYYVHSVHFPTNATKVYALTNFLLQKVFDGKKMKP